MNRTISDESGFYDFQQVTVFFSTIKEYQNLEPYLALALNQEPGMMIVPLQLRNLQRLKRPGNNHRWAYTASLPQSISLQSVAFSQLGLINLDETTVRVLNIIVAATNEANGWDARLSWRNSARFDRSNPWYQMGSTVNLEVEINHDQPDIHGVNNPFIVEDQSIINAFRGPQFFNFILSQPDLYTWDEVTFDTDERINDPNQVNMDLFEKYGLVKGPIASIPYITQTQPLGFTLVANSHTQPSLTIDVDPTIVNDLDEPPVPP